MTGKDGPNQHFILSRQRLFFLINNTVTQYHIRRHSFTLGFPQNSIQFRRYLYYHLLLPIVVVVVVVVVLADTVLW